MKKIVAIFSMLVLLFQAGGFALHYFVLERNSTLNEDTNEVYVNISMPYQNDWQSPERAIVGKQDFPTSDHKISNEVDVQTNMDDDPYARDRFLQLAEQVNEYLGDENSSGPANKKLIVTLISEYCELAESWVFYIVEWPLKRLINQHLTLSIINFQSDVYSPPRKA
jgi:hypothetical protein